MTDIDTTAAPTGLPWYAPFTERLPPRDGTSPGMLPVVVAGAFAAIVLGAVRGAITWEIDVPPFADIAFGMALGIVIARFGPSFGVHRCGALAVATVLLVLLGYAASVYTDWGIWWSRARVRMLNQAGIEALLESPDGGEARLSTLVRESLRNSGRPASLVEYVPWRFRQPVTLGGATGPAEAVVFAMEIAVGLLAAFVPWLSSRRLGRRLGAPVAVARLVLDMQAAGADESSVRERLRRDGWVTESDLRRALAAGEALAEARTARGGWLVRIL